MALRTLAPYRNHSGVAPAEVGIFGSLHREIDRLFEDVTRGFNLPRPAGLDQLMPSTDVTETDKEIAVTAEMPGLERKDVEITLENDILTIRGEKKIEIPPDQKDTSKNQHLSERAYGVFYRTLQLPPGIDPASIQATMSKGVLKVTIPKPARSQPKKIEVKDAA
ncbi:MAG: Hsp20/alpha crystallin family protein [Candidatus Eremiobacteraeota bacterium]|nr:Hsp20/alpha crystallin family protein [Candidatus Eremiobacteraeota bacterium]